VQICSNSRPTLTMPKSDHHVKDFHATPFPAALRGLRCVAHRFCEVNAFRSAFRTVSGSTNTAGKVAVAWTDPLPATHTAIDRCEALPGGSAAAISASIGLVHESLAVDGIFDMSEIVTCTAERGLRPPSSSRPG
jgi:hypothetical protein